MNASARIVLRQFVFSVVLLLSFTFGVFAWAGALTGSKAPEVFGPLVGPEFVNAEQNLVEKIPAGADILNTIGKRLPFKNSFTNNGALPNEYTPSEGNVFHLTTVYIPEDKFSLIAEAEKGSSIMDRLVITDANGRRWIPFFIHPNEIFHYSDLISKYPHDTTRWIASPTSSARSMMVKDEDGMYAPFIIKASLSVRMGGAQRLIDDERIARAVTVNDLVEGIHENTKGLLPESGKKWDFFRETYAALPESRKLGGYIVRELPQEMKDDIVLPIYSLIADRSPKPRWIDVLYQKSGRSSMADFIWEDIVKPEIELHSLYMKNGLTTEFHQQNVCLAVDRESGKIKGLVVRDMDGSWIDHSLRVHRLKLDPVHFGSFEQDAYLFRYGMAPKNHFESYVKILRDDNINRTFRYALSRPELNELLRKGDEFMVSQFNEAFPEVGLKDISGYEAAWKKLDHSATSPTEFAVYQRLLEKYRSRGVQKFLKKLHIRKLNAKLKRSDESSRVSLFRCITSALKSFNLQVMAPENEPM